MDFKRIQTIFLVAFFFLNIFLLVTYRQGLAETNIVQESNNFENIENRLQAEKISYPKTFSNKKRTGYYLSGVPTNFYSIRDELSDHQMYQFDGNELMATFQQSQLLMSDKKKSIEALSHYVQKQTKILYGEEYLYADEILQAEEDVYFTQSFEGIPFKDESAELILTLNRLNKNQLTVTGYSQTHLADIEILREKQQIISERDAIITLYMANKIPSEAKIRKTKLAYTSIFTVQNKNVYIPAWFVWIENTKKNVQIERVNGFSNAIITSNVPSVKGTENGV